MDVGKHLEVRTDKFVQVSTDDLLTTLNILITPRQATIEFRELVRANAKMIADDHHPVDERRSDNTKLLQRRPNVMAATADVATRPRRRKR